MDNKRSKSENIEILTQLLICGVFNEKINEKTAQKLNTEALTDIYSIASQHDLSHIVGDALDKNGLLPQGLLAGVYQKDVLSAIFRYEKLRYAFKEGCAALEKAEIPFIPLKGAVLYDRYPEKWMRISCDIDILVHKGDIPLAVKVFEEKLQCKRCGETFHDVRLRSPDGVTFEIHHTLIEDGFANNANDILKNVWDYTYLREGCEFHRCMTDEMFYFYHVAHIAKHIEHGGCGIKPFLDLCVIKKYMSTSQKTLLEKCDLLKFDASVNKLSEVWFNNDQHDEGSILLQKFVVDGGVYGNRENQARVRKGRSGNKVRYILSRIFLPYSELKYEFPVLQKIKFLFPIYTVCRWVKFIFKKDKDARFKNLVFTKDISMEQSCETARLLEKIGL